MTLEIEGLLLLAAEDCDETTFKEIHYFSPYENRIIRQLVAHGPVLLRGSRGSGKSALMIEAARRINSQVEYNESIIAVYLSMRHLPLLRCTGKDYDHHFFQLLVSETKKVLLQLGHRLEFCPALEVKSVRDSLNSVAGRLNRRVVLLFDDAAHIGREAPLEEFFDIFRTISGSSISCKAAIYPGVTHTGARFDVYNDATVIDLARNEDSQYFGEFFRLVASRRIGSRLEAWPVSRDLSVERVVEFLARAVLGNVRGFVRFSALLSEFFQENPGKAVGLPEIGDFLLRMAQEHYWPLLEELKPKLGRFEPFIGPARDLADGIYSFVAGKGFGIRSAVVHRDVVDRLLKLFEILEYTGFIGKREASRSLKSGGRGPRYAMNLCNLFERTSPTRLTRELMTRWLSKEEEPAEITKHNRVADLEIPEPSVGTDLSILGHSLDVLRKSNAYPYGLTESKLTTLREAGINTVGDLTQCSDTFIDDLYGIGPRWVQRIRNVVAQAIWM